MKVINGTLTAEVKAEIENIVKMAKKTESEIGSMITSHRYAVKNGFVYDNAKGYMPIKVTRYLRIYGSGIAGMNDVIDGCTMFRKEDIIKAGLTPVSEKEIAKHGEIKKFVIDHNNIRTVYSAE